MDSSSEAEMNPLGRSTPLCSAAAGGVVRREHCGTMPAIVKGAPCGARRSGAKIVFAPSPDPWNQIPDLFDKIRWSRVRPGTFRGVICNPAERFNASCRSKLDADLGICALRVDIAKRKIRGAATRSGQCAIGARKAARSTGRRDRVRHSSLNICTEASRPECIGFENNCYLRSAVATENRNDGIERAVGTGRAYVRLRRGTTSRYAAS
jgi:hypothetical protein